MQASKFFRKTPVSQLLSLEWLIDSCNQKAWQGGYVRFYSTIYQEDNLDMASEDVAASVNLMPDHLKDEAKQKFHQLTGFAKSSANEVKRMTSQAADKVKIRAS